MATPYHACPSIHTTILWARHNIRKQNVYLFHSRLTSKSKVLISRPPSPPHPREEIMVPSLGQFFLPAELGVGRESPWRNKCSGGLSTVDGSVGKFSKNRWTGRLLNLHPSFPLLGIFFNYLLLFEQSFKQGSVSSSEKGKAAWKFLTYPWSSKITHSTVVFVHCLACFTKRCQ